MEMFEIKQGKWNRMPVDDMEWSVWINHLLEGHAMPHAEYCLRRIEDAGRRNEMKDVIEKRG